MKSLTLVLVILLLLPSFALGQVVTSCSASKGYSYFFRNPLIPGSKSEWQEDKISKGQIMLVFEGKEKNVNIYYKDIYSTRSPMEDGGKVYLLYADKNLKTILVLVDYPGSGTIENYLFKLDENGKGEVAWGSVKGVGLVPKSGLYTANCSKGIQ